MYIAQYTSKTAENLVLGIPKAGLHFTKAALYTATGVAASIFSALTLGLSKKINDKADNACYSKVLITLPFLAVGRVINPNYQGHDDGDGIFTKTFAQPISIKAQEASGSKNFFTRHVISRLAYAASSVVTFAARVADFALGIILAAVSVFPLFCRVETLNTLALKHLSSTQLIGDLCRNVRGIINPQQFRIQYTQV